MGHFVKYLQRHKQYSTDSPVFSSIGIAIIIPCFNELDILSTLESLCKCTLPDCNIEIIVVINSPEYATKKQLEQNETTYSLVTDFSLKLPSKLHISILSIPKIRKKDAGAGYARKIGMDEAIRLFSLTRNNNGIIVSLDADCLVSTNYLETIYRSFQENPKLNTVIICFEHFCKEKEKNKRLYSAGILYELYLRYYVEILRYTGFPYAYHTIGSCFAISAEAYVKVGGMNRKQAGEDFYFLHKLFPLGNIKEINDAVVYPEIRESDRVVFGTGPAIHKILEQNELCWETFSLEAFLNLKKLFEQIDVAFKADDKILNQWLNKLPESVKLFLLSENYQAAIIEINANCATLKNFRKRFFGWFNAFMVLKFLHYSHSEIYRMRNITELAKEFLKFITIKVQENLTNEELLRIFRDLQKK